VACTAARVPAAGSQAAPYDRASQARLRCAAVQAHPYRGVLEQLLQRVKADEEVLPFHSESDLLLAFACELKRLLSALTRFSVCLVKGWVMTPWVHAVQEAQHMQLLHWAGDISHHYTTPVPSTV
jgi:hypothetical protein